MKKRFSFLIVAVLMLLAACNTNEQNNPSNPVDRNADENNQTNERSVSYELLHELNTIPPEVGTSISIVQDEKLYLVWADIFEFDSIPKIDFETEEVLFVTSYSDGCGRVLESVEKEGETLIIKLIYPDEIKEQKNIVCTEIALPKTYVVKMKHTNTTQGKLIDINRTISEEKSIVQEKLK